MSLRIALVMMQKNERLLLDYWLSYHQVITDPASIFVFDNGSTDPQTLAILRAAEESGISVSRDYSRQKDYYDRGIIFANFIKQQRTTIRLFEFTLARSHRAGKGALLMAE